ncbi:carbohydrate ABC transporter substrate-binding protein [Brenneria izadpanahii]|uniref:Probable sugar-binding periplasmic protein n=1 Tax=Brenneria izadpanahii TaxID=2722756 RepID=A0ABX7UWF2_9GAMM|nr:ABC transporter substrate-binding protein [Brenneria izadpanahii]QTF10123.1 carbohydrate ABC transporter substrate-binding protein [Brenneria izadpanahii]
MINEINKSLLCILAVSFLLAARGVSAQSNEEVIHGWTSSSESAAVRVYAEAYNRAGGHWVDTAIAGGSNARTLGINRIVGGNPPMAMQFSIGRRFDDLIEADLLTDLQSVVDKEYWKKVLYEPVYQSISRDDNIYAVPVGLHGQNWLWTNNELFQEAGLSIPKNWSELVEVGREFKKRGVIPLAVAGVPIYEQNLFNAVLSSYGGGDLYRKIYIEHDIDAIKGEAFADVVTLFDSLHELVDAGSPGRSWSDTTALIIHKKAAMEIMADFAKGEFFAAGKQVGKDFECNLLGPEFIFSGDVFVFPRTADKAQQAAQQRLINVAFDPVNQVAFAAQKGSLPPRADADVSSLDICAQKAHAVLQKPGNLLGGVPVLLSPQTLGELQDNVSRFWNRNIDSERFIARFADIIAQEE